MYKKTAEKSAVFVWRCCDVEVKVLSGNERIFFPKKLFCFRGIFYLMENKEYNTHSSRNAKSVYEKDGKWYKVYDEERKT